MRRFNNCIAQTQTDITVDNRYEEAVSTLNTLQSNARLWAEIKKSADKQHRHHNVRNMTQFLSRLNIQLDELDRLNVIHISGTKGKGSTCAFCESILRHQGYKTGFYSSPHLIETRERIQLNGAPISKEKFITYFWEVYNRLDETKVLYDGQMPKFFCFLTVMAIYTFLKENIDVAVMEVGIGGLYDCTNVIKRPVVCGVTSLGIDHTSVLGDTIGSIAYHKSGIFKAGSPAVTVTQPAEAMDVLLERSKEFNASLYLAPTLCQYTSSSEELHLGICGNKQRLNAAMALQICRIWVDHHGKENYEQKWVRSMEDIVTVGDIPVLNGYQLSDDIKLGLKSCWWPGRHQVLKRPGVTFYLDGAHTVESLEDCAEWFCEETSKEKGTKECNTVKILIFNATGDRSAEVLFPKLLVCGFDCSIFCPNKLNADVNPSDQSYLMVTSDSEMATAKQNKDIWTKLLSDRLNMLQTEKSNRLESNSSCKCTPVIEDQLAVRCSQNGDESTSFCNEAQNEKVPPAYILPSVSDSLTYVCQGREEFDLCLRTTHPPPLPNIDESVHIQVLICGGHHLIESDITSQRALQRIMSGFGVINKEATEAVRTLNTLQSNAQVLAEIRKSADKHRHHNIPNMMQFLTRLNIQLDELDRLNVIHISGTKGKGSTCAFCESILRQQGYKTGFYSSPHLVETRERIQLNGAPISKEKFVTYFWQVYSRLDETKMLYDGQMPKFFCFLTVMAIYTFLKENIDVAVMEVGIGGLYDSTNVIKRPVVCGVTSLGLDHTSVLGNTIGSIAYHKAGIFKTGVPAVTITQPAEAIKVLLERSKELNASLYLAPTLCQYSTGSEELHLGINGSNQSINAAMALQICRIWVDHHGKEKHEQKWVRNMDDILTVGDIPVLDGYRLSDDIKLGLQSCWWPGRHQVLKRPGVTFYLDGAHTAESLEDCAEWFSEEASKEEETQGCNTVKILIFNATGDRCTEVLLSKLLICGFDCSIFCPNKLNADGNPSDQSNFMVTADSQIAKALQNKDIWTKLLSDRLYFRKLHSEESNLLEQNSSSECIPDIEDRRPHNGDEFSSASGETQTERVPHAYFLPSISDSLMYVCHGREKFDRCQKTAHPPPLPDIDENSHIQILICGSLHLIGGVLKLFSNKLNIDIFPPST